MSTESKLAVVLRYLLYITAFVPLIIFSDFISPFHFGKVVVFRSLVEIMVVPYVLLMWADASYRPKTTRIFWAFLFFTLAFSVTTVTSTQPFQSFWGTLERMGGLWTFWHFFLFFIILTSVLRTRKNWLTFFEITVFVGLLSAFYGFGQKTNISWIVGSGDRARIFGTIGNAALFAGYQLLNLFLALTLFFLPESTKNRKIFFASSVLIMGIAVMMTAVRGSLLGLGVGLSVFALSYVWIYRPNKIKKVFIGLAIFFIILIGTTFLFRSTSVVQNSGYLKRVTNFSIDAYTVQTRFWAWQAGLKGWSENPEKIVFGWGPENFNIPFSKYFNPKFFAGPGSETLFDRAHNMFVEVLVTMGLLGFLTYLGIFLELFKELGKKIKERSADTIFGVGFTALTIAYMIHNSFIFDTSANFLTFFSILGFVSYLSVSGRVDKNLEHEDKKSLTTRPNKAIYNTVAVFLTIGSLTLIYNTNIQQVKANYATTRAIISGWNNDFDGAVSKYKEAVSYNVPGKYEERHQFAQYMIDRTANKSSLAPNVIDAMKLAIDYAQKNADEYPRDYLPQLYLSRLNIILGKNNPKSPYNDEALKHSLKALEISPTFVRTFYEVGQAYINKNDIDHAAEYFKKAAELNPDVGISYWYWAAIEMQRGNPDLGQELATKAVMKGYALGENEYLSLVNSYLKKNDFQKIALLYEKLIGINPKNAQYHASLAVAYSRLGRIDDAISQAKDAAGIDPSFEAEAKRFVQSLGKVW